MLSLGASAASGKRRSLRPLFIPVHTASSCFFGWRATAAVLSSCALRNSFNSTNLTFLQKAVYGRDLQLPQVRSGTGGGQLGGWFGNQLSLLWRGNCNSLPQRSGCAPGF